ncbi:nucleotidyl transferase AbiEii/AbiGii toxin family protein [Candidatus Roizmanbacteria bacterium]|nr:nucleotidyl transferase AbiEii/AbiGii toxin family protein [Candidatus Roizmanbacteria bacterium]
MAKSIFSQFQIKVLADFKKSYLTKKFYLSGGTALAEFYLHHRLSEDLDFFTQEELNIDGLKKFINTVSQKIPVKKIEFQHGYGLYTFFITTKIGEKHKIDFGQYPFGPIEKLKNFNGLLVEGLFDIAVNKAQTIAFRPRLRDFIDLYFIIKQKPEWTFQELLKKSFEKFEMQADALQVGQNLLEVEKQIDMPIMIKKIDMNKVKEFFFREAQKLENKIFK